MIVGGRPHRGPNGAAGEIGNLRLLGWCDAPDDLEAHGADVEAVFSAAPSDLEAADAVRAYASALANGISALVLTLDPDLVLDVRVFPQASALSGGFVRVSRGRASASPALLSLRADS